MLEPLSFLSPLRLAFSIWHWILRKIYKHKNKYSGALDIKFSEFISSKSKLDILELSLHFNSEQSGEILNSTENIFLWCDTAETVESKKEFPDSCSHPGLEIGFYSNDPELVFNTRFRDSVWLEGFFKIHSVQGPYQGVYSYMLKGVGVENLPK